MARPTTSLKTLEVTLPPQELVRHFDNLLEPLVDREAANSMEMRSLAAMRDFLLPRLMSGRVRVKDAEKIVEMAA
ncbi:MAG: type I restriction endonuclease subunit S [Reyranella sp.]|nr:type I restriction endonuclease subunit S [Reyranella sp.]